VTRIAPRRGAAALNAAYARRDLAAPGNRVVFLGDSITQSSALNESAGVAGSVAGYPFYAQAFGGGKIIHARNAGSGGETTAQMLARFDTDVTPYTPRVVSILAGTNDIRNDVPLATFQANIAALVAETLAIGAKPILGTITPTNTSGHQQRVNLWNQWLRRYAAANGVGMVDYFSLLVNPATGNYAASAGTADGLHPGEAGYRLMGQAFANAVTSAMPPHVPPLVQTQADTQQILGTNSLFLTDSNADGTPDGWDVWSGLTGVTRSLVSTDAAAPGKAMKVVLAAAPGLFEVRRQITTGFSVGDRLSLAALISSNGGVNVQFRIQFTGASSNGWIANFTGTITRGLTFREFTVPASTTAVILSLITAAGTGEASVEQVSLYNLTTGGIV
jgi:lysophospholipase L1-like esterase